ncbi:hypothetical protein G9A89_011788 [Geosiphon pyriformis]|nr:hypothetical protein G9A89_011788 [Geosiphon pyriformis]
MINIRNTSGNCKDSLREDPRQWVDFSSASEKDQTIPPAVATEDSSLAAIFPFELEENEAMFSGAALDEKRPITTMYTEATVNNTPIKLILDSGSAGSIITLQLVNQLGFKVDRAVTSQIITADGSTKLPYGEIDSFPFEINGIVIPTKVLEEEPHDAKLGLYRELSQYTTKEVAVIAATIVKIHREIEQYANENFPISTGNTRERANKTKENLETNQESN